MKRESLVAVLHKASSWVYLGDLVDQVPQFAGHRQVQGQPLKLVFAFAGFRVYTHHVSNTHECNGILARAQDQSETV